MECHSFTAHSHSGFNSNFLQLIISSSAYYIQRTVWIFSFFFGICFSKWPMANSIWNIKWKPAAWKKTNLQMVARMVLKESEKKNKKWIHFFLLLHSSKLKQYAAIRSATMLKINQNHTVIVCKGLNIWMAI